MLGQRLTRSGGAMGKAKSCYIKAAQSEHVLQIEFIHYQRAAVTPHYAPALDALSLSFDVRLPLTARALITTTVRASLYNSLCDKMHFDAARVICQLIFAVERRTFCV
jgi:hypothetical protein